MERSEIRDGLQGWIAESRITLRSIRATLATRYNNRQIQDAGVIRFAYSLCREILVAALNISPASVARIERSEIRGLAFGAELPFPDFAPLNPGYALLPRPQSEFAQVTASLPQRVEPFAGGAGDGGDGATFLLVGGGLLQAVPQAMPYETQGVGDVDHLVELVLHVEAKLDQFLVGAARAHKCTGTLASRRHGKTPANPAWSLCCDNETIDLSKRQVKLETLYRCIPPKAAWREPL
jgi:hypothetical protein